MKYNRYADESGPADQDCTDDTLQNYRDDKDDTLDECYKTD